MSRAININMDESAVMARCAKEKVGVSAIEKLPEGGVRLVTTSGEGADRIRAKLKKDLIGGDVTRERHRPVKPMW